MIKPPVSIVNILVTINDMAHFEACTLCFKTLRIGWPTAEINIYVNGGEYRDKVEAKLRRYQDLDVSLFSISQVHHAEWIRRRIYTSSAGPMVIADPDIIYWKSCENWKFNEDVVLGGYYIPRMWNDFSQCISASRIHTSMMVFPNTARLYLAIREAYPWAYKKNGDYCPCEPFSPRVSFMDGQPVFWDTCANLYGMLHSLESSVMLKRVEHFRREHLQCYDHMNSASFYQVMSERLEGPAKEGFLRVHNDWVLEPTPNLWPLVDNYYQQKAIEAIVRQPANASDIV